MPFRVLVADDEELERRALRLILGGPGMPELEIVEAANGREALDLVGEGRLDAAFLDIRMPGVDGIEAARLLRLTRPGLPIVFLTAFDSFEYARSALRLRVEDFLLKPASPDEVTAALRRVLPDASLPGPSHTKLESAISYLADLLRADLAEGLLVEARVERYLELAGRPGGLRAVLALRLGSPSSGGGAALRGAAELAERVFSSPSRIALAGAGPALALCAVLGEASSSGAEDEYEFRSDLELLLERSRSELGAVLAAGAAIASPGKASATAVELARAARRAAALTGPSRPIVLLSLSASHEGALAPRSDLTASGGGTAYRALELIEERHAEELSLELVAEELGVSPSHLSRLLARHAGAGFADCLGRLRVERAKGLLRSSGASIKEVSNMVGFRDPAYFARVFRRFEGESPAVYRLRSSLGGAAEGEGR